MSVLGTTYYASMLPSADGTYVARSYGQGDVQLDRISEPDGYEVAYDAMNQNVEVPSLFIQPGDRIGIWTNPATGEKCIDRTIHFRGPEELAVNLGRQYEQLAIWSWKDNYALMCD